MSDPVAAPRSMWKTPSPDWQSFAPLPVHEWKPDELDQIHRDAMIRLLD